MPFEVPEGWVWTTVSEISNSILYGVSESAKVKGEYKLLRITDIQDNKVDWESVPFTDFDSSKVSSYLLQNNDILFARTGATVGKSYLVQNLTDKAIYASYLIRVQMPKMVLPNYVKYFFESGYYWGQINLKSVGVGQPNVNGTILGDLSIPIPGYKEQHRIVIEIEKWFALIDVIESSKEDLQSTIKQAKSKILDLAIHGKLVPQDPNDEPAMELLRRINPKAEITCDNAHYEQLPKEWELTQMGNLCKLTDGEKQNGCKMVNLDVKYLRGEKEGKILDAGRKVEADTLLILVDGENSGEVFRTPIEGYQGSTFKVLAINPNMNEEYILHAIRMKQKVLRESKVGSAIPHLNKKLFKEMFVPIPSYKEQLRIVESIDKVMTLIDRVAGEL